MPSKPTKNCLKKSDKHILSCLILAKDKNMIFREVLQGELKKNNLSNIKTY